MTNTELLKLALQKSGYRLRFVSEQLGISYQAFLNKLNNMCEFKASEIYKLTELLSLSLEDKEHIFFCTSSR